MVFSLEFFNSEKLETKVISFMGRNASYLFNNTEHMRLCVNVELNLNFWLKVNDSFNYNNLIIFFKGIKTIILVWNIFNCNN